MEKAFWKQMFGNIPWLRSIVVKNDVLPIKTHICTFFNNGNFFFTCPTIFQRKYFSEFLTSWLKILKSRCLLFRSQENSVLSGKKKLPSAISRKMSWLVEKMEQWASWHSKVQTDTHIFHLVLSYWGSNFFSHASQWHHVSKNRLCCFTKYNAKTCKNNGVCYRPLSH